MARLVEVCARVARPERFTNHEHCDECADADDFFRGHTPESLGSSGLFPETLPLAFLTPEAFRYFMPALILMLVKDTAATDLLILIENKLDTFDREESDALRDVLYAIYDAKPGGFHSGFFTYEALSRVIDRLT